jgi:hypothetical protein
MGVAIVLDPQNGVAFVAGRPGLSAAASPLSLTLRTSPGACVQLELGPHERHRADFPGNIDVMVRLYRVWLYGHVPNYTANADRCRVFRHA